jgi:hypothetical protein
LVTINYKKCGVMELKRNRNEEQEGDLEGELWGKFPKVNSYKYLGINISQNMQPSEHIAHLEKKLAKFKKMALINRL